MIVLLRLQPYDPSAHTSHLIQFLKSGPGNCYAPGRRTMLRDSDSLSTPVGEFFTSWPGLAAPQSMREARIIGSLLETSTPLNQFFSNVAFKWVHSSPVAAALIARQMKTVGAMRRCWPRVNSVKHLHPVSRPAFPARGAHYRRADRDVNTCDEINSVGIRNAMQEASAKRHASCGYSHFCDASLANLINGAATDSNLDPRIARFLAINPDRALLDHAHAFGC